jgi:putative redox protein
MGWNSGLQDRKNDPVLGYLKALGCRGAGLFSMLPRGEKKSLKFASSKNRAKMTNTIEVRWKGDLKFESIAPEGRVMIDADSAVGGNGAGLRPKAMMLSSLAGCTAMDVASLLKKMRVEVDDIRITAEGHLTDEHPKVYDKVKVTYRFYGSEFKKDKIEKAIQLSVERYCGVMDMFRKFAEISLEVLYIEQ